MNNEIFEPRNRDLVKGSIKARAMFAALYEWLAETNHLPTYNRVFRGIPSTNVDTMYAKDLDFTTNSNKYSNMVHLGSYNYSGLNGDQRIINAAMQALKEYGVTTSGVRLLNGTSDLHIKFEKKLAGFLGTEDAVTYSSGYVVNLSVLSALCSENDIVLSDELNHQSIVDGLKLSRAKVIKFPHRDVDNLRAVLKSIPRVQRKFIVTDGIFSMDGDIAPLDKMVEIAKETNAFIIVDEAHATAAYGPLGRGTPAHFNVVEEIDVITGSLSKGLPGVGGFAAGKKHSMDFLRYCSNGYIFSASLPPAIPAGLSKALDILATEPEIQDKLHANELLLREGIKSMGLNVMHSESPIIPILLPSRDIAFKYARLLYENNIYVNAVSFPAVSRKLSRLRLNASAALSKEDIDKSLVAVHKVGQELGLIS